jgi:alkylhydroperoxidase family enzyme
MEPMYLPEIEQHAGAGRYRTAIDHLRAHALPVPQIMHLFAYKPDRTEHLAEFTHGVMRGSSPLSPGQRELIAAFTSRRNGCPF